MAELKFQWSIKLDNGEIYVAQADTVDDLVFSRDEVRSKALGQHTTPTISAVDSVVLANTQPGIVCTVCGGKAEINSGISKANNPYRIFKCLNNPELKTKGGHSYFMR